MRLTELSPRWCAEYNAPPDAKQGVSFLCPHCKVTRLAIFFAPTICGREPVDIKLVHKQQILSDQDPQHVGHLADEHVGRIVWTRVNGETFDTLSLQPSIDASAWGCWHGHITNGEVQ
jgi:hypothetical protein